MAAREVRRGSGINGSWAGRPVGKCTGSFQAAGECIKAESTGSNPVAGGSYAAVAGLLLGRDDPVVGAAMDRTTVGVASTYTPELVTRRPALGCLFEIVETLVLTLIIFFVIQTFVAQPYQIRQQSMETTLEPDQYVLVDKLTPRFDTYKRGDVVVFTPPEVWTQSDGTPYIKRVIGVGEDTIEIHDGKVFVNGTALVEPYVFKDPDGQAQPTEDPLQTEKWVVPDGELFLMGDHRGSSADSREFGTVAVEKVIGRAWLRYWPIDTLMILPTPTHPELQSPTP
jgi:signal peptidase I